MASSFDIMQMLRKGPANNIDKARSAAGAGGSHRRPVSNQELSAYEKWDQLPESERIKLVLSQGKTHAFSYLVGVQDSPDALYKDLVEMGDSGLVSAYLDIVTNDATKPSDLTGKRVWVDSFKDSDGKEWQKEANDLLDQLDVEERVWSWVRNMCHFGDKFLKLQIAPNQGVISVRDDFLPIEVARVEFNGKVGAFLYSDPDFSPITGTSNFFNVSAFQFSNSSLAGPDAFAHFMIKHDSDVRRVAVDIPIDEIDRAAENAPESSWKRRFAKSLKESRETTRRALREAVLRKGEGSGKLVETLSLHGADFDEDGQLTFDQENARVVITTRRGHSILANSRRDFKMLNMADQSLALARFARAPQARVFYIDTSGASVREREEMVTYLKGIVEGSYSFDASKQLYQGSYSPHGFVDDMFIPYSGARGDVRVETIGGDTDVRAMVDIDYWVTRWFAAVNMNKEFMNFNEMLPGFNADKSLARMDIRYASTINNVQLSAKSGFQTLISTHLKYKHGVDILPKRIPVQMMDPSSAEEAELLENQEKELSLIERKADLLEGIGGNKQAVLKDLLADSNIFEKEQIANWISMGPMEQK